MFRRICCAALFCVLSFAASATDFGVTLKDLQGEEIVERGSDGKSTSITLGVFCVNALIASYPDERDLKETDKLARFKLALRISEKWNTDLSAAEADLIVRLVSKAYGPLIVGRVAQVIDPNRLK